MPYSGDVDSNGYSWDCQGRRSVWSVVAFLVTMAILLPFVAKRPGHYIGMGIAAVVLAPLLIWWMLQHRDGTPLVSVSVDGITPHEFSTSPIPWNEVLGTRFGSHGIHSLLVIETTKSDRVRETLRPFPRALVRTLGWWTIGGSGISVTLSLMSAADRSHFLDVLNELGIVQ